MNQPEKHHLEDLQLFKYGAKGKQPAKKRRIPLPIAVPGSLMLAALLCLHFLQTPRTTSNPRPTASIVRRLIEPTEPVKAWATSSTIASFTNIEDTKPD